jgi:glycosyltransferase involved in cell wall biosynthesis
MTDIRVLVIGIGNPVPSFIQRRLAALLRAGVYLTVVADHGQSIDLPGANVIRVGGKRTLAEHIGLFFMAMTHPLVFLRLVSVASEFKRHQRLRWTVKMLPLVRIPPPNLVHFQWLGLLGEYRWLKNFFACPFIGSARGSQVSVYPITRSGHREKMQKAIQHADFIHCVSLDIASACERLGAPSQKLLINYNGINLEEFRPNDHPKSFSGITILSVGSLIWRKGFMFQLIAMKALLAKGYDIRLLLVGDGPDMEALIYTAHRLGISHSIRFIGQVKSRELANHFKEADIFLSTSSAEGLANCVVEAIASGLPIVSFECEGMREAILHGENGFILPFGDVDGLTEKIAYLVENPKERERMGERARHLAIEKFDDQKWVEHMISIYNELT